MADPVARLINHRGEVVIVGMRPEQAAALDAVVVAAERCDQDLRDHQYVTTASATTLRRALDHARTFRRPQGTAHVH